MLVLQIARRRRSALQASMKLVTQEAFGADATAFWPLPNTLLPGIPAREVGAGCIAREIPNEGNVVQLRVEPDLGDDAIPLYQSAW